VRVCSGARVPKHAQVYDARAAAFGAGPYHLYGGAVSQVWTSEDDRLLCCLMAEFSENMGLVADVYISTRRLEGLYFELATTMERIRNIAKARARLLLTLFELQILQAFASSLSLHWRPLVHLC
jgi:hypothetical protein